MFVQCFFKFQAFNCHMKRIESFVISIASEYMLSYPQCLAFQKNVLLYILRTRVMFLSQIELVVFEKKTLTFLAFSTYSCVLSKRTRFFMSFFPLLFPDGVWSLHRQEAFPGDEGERETFEGECSGAAGQIKAAPGSLLIQNQRNRELCREGKNIYPIF